MGDILPIDKKKHDDQAIMERIDEDFEQAE